MITGPRGLPDHLTGVDRTLVMGILNVTPDSFSDGGEHLGAEAAVAHGRAMVAAGADIVDVGGESTRPGAARVSPAEELERVLPVIRALAADGIAVSVDTMRAEVADAAIRAGALVINDVSGGLADPAMGETAASLRTRLGMPPVMVAMHWRGHSDVMTGLARYEDLPQDVTTELGAAIDRLLAAGVDREAVVADPGLGFSKEGEQDWELLAATGTLAGLGLPLLIGASRKRFLARLGADRDAATAAVSTAAALFGAWAVRVHDVPGSLAAVRVAERLRAHGVRLDGCDGGGGVVGGRADDESGRARP